MESVLGVHEYRRGLNARSPDVYARPLRYHYDVLSLFRRRAVRVEAGISMETFVHTEDAVDSAHKVMQ